MRITNEASNFFGMTAPGYTASGRNTKSPVVGLVGWYPNETPRRNLRAMLDELFHVLLYVKQTFFSLESQALLVRLGGMDIYDGMRKGYGVASMDKGTL